MKLFISLVWTLAGTGLAYTYLLTQRWSISIIHPDQPNWSQLLVVGGAFIRWAVIFSIFYLVLSHSVISLLIVFSSFMISRNFLLIKCKSFSFTSKNLDTQS